MRRPVVTRRRALAAAILGLWLVVVGLHIRREYFKPLPVVLAEGARLLGPGTHFYGIRMDDRAIGLASSRLDTLPDGFVFEDMMTLDVPALDTITRAVTETRVELGRSLDLRAFSFQLRSDAGRFSVRGVASGDSAVEMTVAGNGAGDGSTLRLDGSAVLAATLPLRLAAAGRLQEGESFTTEVFDPSVMSGRDVEIRVGERDTLIVPDSAVADSPDGRWRAATYDTVPVWRVEQRFAGVAVESWIDDDGRIVRAESPLGFAIERSAYELIQQALAETRGDRRLAGGYGPVIESTAIASNVTLDAATVADRVRLRLLDVDLGGFDLDGGRQRLSGDTLVITREAAASLRADYRLPWAGPSMDEALAATALIQADAPAIVEQARRIAGDEDDPAIVASRLNEWVHDALEKSITLSVPSATQVLSTLQGDCNEHTVLYVALARALGLPARTAVGLVHLDGRFYYHAWPEVWLDGWVAVDPTLGQFPADASHVRFLLGGIARQVELIRLIGRLNLEIL